LNSFELNYENEGWYSSCHVTLDRYKGEISPYPLLLPPCSGRGDKKNLPSTPLISGKKGRTNKQEKAHTCNYFLVQQDGWHLTGVGATVCCWDASLTLNFTLATIDRFC